MNAERFATITGQYPRLRIGVAGDFCLDRYLDIDASRTEVSIETGLEVYNISRVRSQPGAAGTIVNNLVALGVGQIACVGFAGEDGEGYELRRALEALPGVSLEHFLTTPQRRTFTYCKPLIWAKGEPPRELNRLDSKNWTPTPDGVQHEIAARVLTVDESADAIILMDQVDEPETGAVTRAVREAATCARHLVLADSRRGLADFPPLGFKMNAVELGRLTGGATLEVPDVMRLAAKLALKNSQPVFVTLAERGIVGALPHQPAEHVPAHAVRGPIDIVGAGDAVTANLTAALAAGANVREAMELAMAAASLVIHQLGTTGTASVAEIRQLLGVTST